MPSRPKDAATSRETAQRLAQALRGRRFDRQLTQAQVADRLDISIEAYSRIERGQALPSFPTLLKICETLGTTPDALLLLNSLDVPNVNETRPRPRVRGPALAAGDRGSQAPPARKPDVASRHDDPVGVDLRGSNRLGTQEQERFNRLVELLRRLERSDREAIQAVVEQLAKRAGLLPLVMDD